MASLAPSTDCSIRALLNHPNVSRVSHAVTLQVSEISVNQVLDAAKDQFPRNVVSGVSELKLRWIMEKTKAFPRWKEGQSLADVAEESRVWYATKGCQLRSTPIEDDATLRANWAEIKSGDYVRMYVVALPARAPRLATRVERRRDSYVKALRPRTPNPDGHILATAWNLTPSQAATNRSAHIKAQNGPAPLYDGRQPLANNLGPNACLYHEAFVTLLRDFAQDEGVTLDPAIEAAISKLRFELAQPTVVDKKTYMDVLEEYLPPVFPGTKFHRAYQIPRGKNPDTVLDFVLTCTTPYGVEVVVVAGDAKFLEGNGESALTRALCAYRRVCVGIERDAIFLTSCCPCIILTVCGRTLRVSAAYFAGDVYSTPMDMGGVSLQLISGVDDDYYIKSARQIQAVRNAVKTLSDSYEENHTGAYRDPDHLLPVPYFPPQPGHAWTPALTFPEFSLRFTDARVTTHNRAVFMGEITLSNHNPGAHPVPVYIKFVHQYGAAAHQHLAGKGFAPKLRWYGKVWGGPAMVVMDKVEGSTIDEILAQRDEIPDGQEVPKVEDLVTKKDLKSLDEAIGAMRVGGFLHGDLRAPNVMLHNEPDGSRKAYIIDFDWAGLEGIARYPKYIVLNPEVIWPRDPKTMPGTLILTSDDTEMRSTILKRRKTSIEIISMQSMFTTCASSSSSSAAPAPAPSTTPAPALPTTARRQGVMLPPFAIPAPPSKWHSKRPLEESEPNLDVQSRRPGQPKKKRKRLIASADI